MGSAWFSQQISRQSKSGSDSRDCPKKFAAVRHCFSCARSRVCDDWLASDLPGRNKLGSPESLRSEAVKAGDDGAESEYRQLSFGEERSQPHPASRRFARSSWNGWRQLVRSISDRLRQQRSYVLKDSATISRRPGFMR